MREKIIAKTIKQFNKWAKTYDQGIWSLYFKYSHKKTIDIVESYLRDNNDLKILDIGCGTGNLIISLSSLSNIKELIGIDISPEMINLANDKKNKIKNSNKIIFFVGDVHKLNFANNYFDIIFSLNSFHHYYTALKEINRVLKKSGFFVLLDNFLDNPLRKMWTIFLKFYFKEKEIKYFTKKDLNKFLITHGLQVIEQQMLLYFILLSICKKKYDI